MHTTELHPCMHGLHCVHIQHEKRNKNKQKNTWSRRRENSLAAVGCWGGRKQKDGLVARSSRLDWWPAAAAQGRGQEDASSISSDHSSSCSIQQSRSRLRNNYLQSATILDEHLSMVVVYLEQTATQKNSKTRSGSHGKINFLQRVKRSQERHVWPYLKPTIQLECHST
jgi:hypothetical protein